MQKNTLITLVLLGTLIAGFYLYHGQQNKPNVTSEPKDLKQIYNQWKTEYKVRVGASEDDYRFKIFSSNYERIASHNSKPNTTYKLGLNPFAHLTSDEFTATHLGLKSNSDKSKNITVLPTDNLTSKVDWRPKLNPVKDQGHCGSCWAFSAVGAVEGVHSAVKGKLYNLAEQELVDCAGTFGNNGCNGGMMDQAFKYVISAKGLASEKDYPYVAVDGQCRSGFSKQGGISSFTDVAGDAKSLKAALSKQPVSVAIEADATIFQLYKEGVINDDSCGTNLDHGVLAVGYDAEDATPYYIVRNSWGPSWGSGGYVKIGIKEGDGVCGIQKMASYPVV